MTEAGLAERLIARLDAIKADPFDRGTDWVYSDVRDDYGLTADGIRAVLEAELPADFGSQVIANDAGCRIAERKP